MKLSDVKDLAILAALAAAIYFVYRGWKKASEAGGIIDTLIAAPIAGAINSTLPGDVVLTGYALLPNSNRVPISSLEIFPDLTFSYNGKRYQIKSRTGQDYVTVAI